MDGELKGPSTETASKTEAVSETNGVKETPPTPKITKASLKTRGRSSERDKERPKSPKDTNKAALPKTRSRSGTPQKLKSETKTLTLTLTKLDEKAIGNEKHKNETKQTEETVNGKPESAEHSANGEKLVEEDKSKDKPKDVSQTEKPKDVNQTEKSPEQKQKSQTEKSPEQKEKKEESTIEPEATNKKFSPKKSEETIEMDPLVLIGTDEADPELLFDETSDLESGKGSPIVSRCKTRRSHTRNIPTPKTPKSDSVATTPEVNDQESEQSEKDDGLNESVSVTMDPSDCIDADDLSTKAEVGSDFTRLDYCEHDSSVANEDFSYLNASRERSLSETLRNLSSRRSIRPLGDDFRKRALRNYQSELNYSYPTTEGVQSVSGMKRKDRSETPEEVTKKFKSESPGLVSLFASPITNLRSKFSRSDVTSSTPKLTGYKDCNKDIRGSEYEYELTNGIVEEKKSWCSVM